MSTLARTCPAAMLTWVLGFVRPVSLSRPLARNWTPAVSRADLAAICSATRSCTVSEPRSPGSWPTGGGVSATAAPPQRPRQVEPAAALPADGVTDGSQDQRDQEAGEAAGGDGDAEQQPG